MASVTLVGRWPVLAEGTSPFLGPGLWLAGALLLGALLVAVFRRWQRQDTLPTASDQLAQFRELYEKGQISEEEYRRLRGVLGGELRRSLNLPAPPASPGAPNPQPPGPSSGPETTEPPPTGIKPG